MRTKTKLQSENKQTTRYIVKCPHCGWEYLLGEILYPNNVVGQPKNIIRDVNGHILYEEYLDGGETETSETYTCDHCSVPFVVDFKIDCEANKQEDLLDFSVQTTQLF